MKYHVVKGRCVLIWGQRSGAAVVRKVGQPLAADKASFAGEEFAVGTVSLTDDRAFPLPCSFFVGEPILRGDHLFDGKTGDAAPEKGKESEFRAACLYVRRTFQRRSMVLFIFEVLYLFDNLLI